MISKAQATAIAGASLANTFMTKLQQVLESNAISGTIGVSAYPYPPVATTPQINAFTTQMQGLGWTVSVDTVGFTVTLS